MSDCIFCKIINGDIPGHIIYENAHVRAFLDISQTTKGHVLVVPKTHAVDIFEMTPESMSHVFSVVPKLATALKKAFQCDGINIVNNNGEVAGQTVFHYHVHLIPRYPDDHFHIQFPNNMSDYTENDFANLKEVIINEL